MLKVILEEGCFVKKVILNLRAGQVFPFDGGIHWQAQSSVYLRTFDTAPTSFGSS